MDNTKDRKIYDRPISKHLKTDGVTSLVGDEDEEDPPPKDFDRNVIKNMSDPILGCVMDRWEKSFTQEPSQQLQLGGQESRLSKAEKKIRWDVTSKKNRLGKIGENF